MVLQRGDVPSTTAPSLSQNRRRKVPSNVVRGPDGRFQRIQPTQPQSVEPVRLRRRTKTHVAPPPASKKQRLAGPDEVSSDLFHPKQDVVPSPQPVRSVCVAGSVGKPCSTQSHASVDGCKPSCEGGAALEPVRSRHRLCRKAPCPEFGASSDPAGPLSSSKRPRPDADVLVAETPTIEAPTTSLELDVPTAAIDAAEPVAAAVRRRIIQDRSPMLALERLVKASARTFVGAEDESKPVGVGSTFFGRQSVVPLALPQGNTDVLARGEAAGVIVTACAKSANKEPNVSASELVTGKLIVESKAFEDPRTAACITSSRTPASVGMEIGVDQRVVADTLLIGANTAQEAVDTADDTAATAIAARCYKIEDRSPAAALERLVLAAGGWKPPECTGSNYGHLLRRTHWQDDSTSMDATSSFSASCSSPSSASTRSCTDAFVKAAKVPAADTETQAIGEASAEDTTVEAQTLAVEFDGPHESLSNTSLLNTSGGVEESTVLVDSAAVPTVDAATTSPVASVADVSSAACGSGIDESGVATADVADGGGAAPSADLTEVDGSVRQYSVEDRRPADAPVETLTMERTPMLDQVAARNASSADGNSSEDIEPFVSFAPVPLVGPNEPLACAQTFQGASASDAENAGSASVVVCGEDNALVFPASSISTQRKVSNAEVSLAETPKVAAGVCTKTLASLEDSAEDVEAIAHIVVTHDSCGSGVALPVVGFERDFGVDVATEDVGIAVNVAPIKMDVEACAVEVGASAEVVDVLAVAADATLATIDVEAVTVGGAAPATANADICLRDAEERHLRAALALAAPSDARTASSGNGASSGDIKQFVSCASTPLVGPNGPKSASGGEPPPFVQTFQATRASDAVNAGNASSVLSGEDNALVFSASPISIQTKVSDAEVSRVDAPNVAAGVCTKPWVSVEDVAEDVEAIALTAATRDLCGFGAALSVVGIDGDFGVDVATDDVGIAVDVTPLKMDVEACTVAVDAIAEVMDVVAVAADVTPATIDVGAGTVGGAAPATADADICFRDVEERHLLAAPALVASSVARTASMSVSSTLVVAPPALCSATQAADAAAVAPSGPKCTSNDKAEIEGCLNVEIYSSTTAAPERSSDDLPNTTEFDSGLVSPVVPGALLSASVGGVILTAGDTESCVASVNVAEDQTVKAATTVCDYVARVSDESAVAALANTHAKAEVVVVAAAAVTTSAATAVDDSAGVASVSAPARRRDVEDLCPMAALARMVKSGGGWRRALHPGGAGPPMMRSAKIETAIYGTPSRARSGGDHDRGDSPHHEVFRDRACPTPARGHSAVSHKASPGTWSMRSSGGRAADASCTSSVGCAVVVPAACDVSDPLPEAGVQPQKRASVVAPGGQNVPACCSQIGEVARDIVVDASGSSSASSVNSGDVAAAVEADEEMEDHCSSSSGESACGPSSIGTCGDIGAGIDGAAGGGGAECNGAGVSVVCQVGAAVSESSKDKSEDIGMLNDLVPAVRGTSAVLGPGLPPRPSSPVEVGAAAFQSCLPSKAVSITLTAFPTSEGPSFLGAVDLRRQARLLEDLCALGIPTEFESERVSFSRLVRVAVCGN
eukprot:TRINITY_DN2257_c0_g1_i3.p1 TRINITY_DN2257_c0_g1~~TRINITY_DN2257_c0_g1_i3.p1  ORF type:complete len:1587 (-),score=327.40 TRINITY_DN2257_c0_g1_i3:203-4963(-)